LYREFRADHPKTDNSSLKLTPHYLPSKHFMNKKKISKNQLYTHLCGYAEKNLRLMQKHLNAR